MQRHFVGWTRRTILATGAKPKENDSKLSQNIVANVENNRFIYLKKSNLETTEMNAFI